MIISTRGNKSMAVLLSFLLVLTTFLPVLGGIGKPAAAAVTAGPIEIHNLADLNNIRNNLDADYILMNDILDAYETEYWNEGEGFEPIGGYSWAGEPFTGTFDGQGHVIYGLHINRPYSDNVGLFGLIDSGAVIKDVRLVNVNITGYYYVGALVGESWDSTVIGSHASGEITGGDTVGGLVGENGYDSTVADSSFTGEVYGDSYTGGVVGNNDGSIINTYADVNLQGFYTLGGLVGYNYGTVSRSFSMGSVTGDEWLGGLIGTGGGTVTDTFSTADVEGEYSVGGLIGEFYGTVRNSYAVGTVQDDWGGAGGLIGGYMGSLVYDSFWNTNTTGQSSSDGGTGKTTEELQDVRTYTDVAWSSGLNDPWDFVGNPNDDEGTDDIWDIDPEVNNGYPFLVIEGSPFDIPIIDKDSAVQAAVNAIEALPELEDITLEHKETVEAARTLVEEAKSEFGAVDSDFGEALVKLEAAEDKIASLEEELKNNAVQVAVDAIEDLPEVEDLTINDKADVEAARALVETAKNDFGAVDADFGEALAKLQAAEDKIIDLETFKIYTLEDLNNVRDDLEASYVLMNDIDASETASWSGGAGFDPIGTTFNAFKGSFDGQGYTVSGLTINRPYSSRVGLFASTDSGAIIKDVFLEDVNITGGMRTGSLVGDNRESTITGSHASGTVSGEEMTGGLAGSSWNGTVTHSSFTGLIEGYGSTGGLVGDNGGTITYSFFTGTVDGYGIVGGLAAGNGGTISRSYAAGFVKGHEYVGGLVGSNSSTGIITDTYSTADVEGYSWLCGGLVGSNEGEINNSYTAGLVTGADSTGGLVGFDWWNEGIAINSFWDTDITGQSTSSGGTGKTTAEMQDVRTFTDTAWSTGLDEPWDFTNDPYDDEGTEDIWIVVPSVNNGYPIFTFEYELIQEKDAAVQAAVDAINALPGLEFLTLGDKAEVEAARGLVEAAKSEHGAVDADFGEALGILEAAEDKIVDLEAAAAAKAAAIQAAVDAIDDLPESEDITLGDKADVEAARDLVEAAKSEHGAVDADFGGALDKLEAVEDKIADLEAAAAAKAAAVQEAVDAIDSLPAVEDVTLGDRADVEAARDLVETVKSEYGAADADFGDALDKLEDLEDRIVELEEDVAKEVAIQDAIDAIDSLPAVEDVTLGDRADVEAARDLVEIAKGQHGAVDADFGESLAKLEALEDKISDLEETPIEINIYTLEDLNNMRNHLRADYILMNDIDASETIHWNEGTGFKPVGGITDSFEMVPFIGSFDGQGFTISGLYIDRPDDTAVGLFGLIDSEAVIRDVHLEDVNITGGSGVGSLVGAIMPGEPEAFVASVDMTAMENEGTLPGISAGTVVNSHASGTVMGFEGAGGLVGYNLVSTINSSSFSGDVMGAEGIGGLVGYSAGAVINSYTNGNVSGSYYVGGIVGANDGQVIDAYSTAEVSGDYDVGGLVGYNDNMISNSSFSGKVTGVGNIGGLAGYNEGIVNNSFSTAEVLGVWEVGGLVGYNYGIVANSYSMGSVTGEELVGGLVGYNYGNVVNSYSTAEVSGDWEVGGLVGYNRGIINSSYATGFVDGDYGAGGLVGYSWQGTANNSFWDMDTTGQSVSDGGTGKTTPELQNVRTFTDVAWSEGLDEPWDFVDNPYDDEGTEDIWNINPAVNSGYPFLSSLLTIPEPDPKDIAVQEAVNAIEALPDIEELKLEDKANVETARDLVDYAKAEHGAVDGDFGDALSTLEAAEARIADLEAAAAAKQAAIDAAVDAIAALPAVGDLTLGDKGAVENARALVDTAKDDHGAVDGDFDNLATLDAAEVRIEDLETIKTAEDFIDELPPLGEITLADSGAVEAARGLVEAAVARPGVDEADVSNLLKLEGLESFLKEVGDAAGLVEAAEDAAEYLSTQELVDAAQDAHDIAKSEVQELAQSDARDALLNRLFIVQSDINNAQAVLDATAAVEAAEDAAEDLSTQELVDAAQDAYDDAKSLVEALAPSVEKGVLESALSDVKETIDSAQAAIDKAAAINAAVGAIAALPAVEDLTLEDKADVETARDLVEAAKFEYGAVDGDFSNLADLDAAENRIAELDTMVFGDISGDGNVTVNDVILLLKHIVGLIDIENIYGSDALLRANVSGTGEPNIGDAILILRFIVGLITEFPIE